MRIQLLAVLTVFAFVAGFPASRGLASPSPQTKRSKSDADINAIGHRNISRGPNFYSPEKEKELGKVLSQEVERTSRLLDDPATAEFIGRVAQNVAKNSDARFPITVRVIDSDEVNAFTLPAGYLYVTRGLLLRLENEAELASILARGIAHTALRTGTRVATKSEVSQIAITVAFPGSDPRTGGIPLAIPLTMLAAQREAEFDADYFGVQYLYKSSYDPKCFTDLVQRVWGSGSASEDKVPKAFGKYPPVEERLASLRKEISEILPPRSGAISSTPEFDAFKLRLPAQKAKPERLELRKPTETTEPQAPSLIPKPE
jgi:predicted Zn-dependent protease